MSQSIHEAPHGMNLVVETQTDRVIVGRFDSIIGLEVLMHDCDVFDPATGGDAEHWTRETATYGVDVKHRDFTFDAHEVTSWRPLGDVEKL
jgi:hypothetical protein